jgi:predicted helicase
MGKAIIFYFTLTDEQTKEEKLTWFSENKLKDIPFDHIIPDRNNNWINLSDNDFETLIPLIDKDVKAGKSKKALFGNFSSGLKSGRDEWVVNFDINSICKKVNFLMEHFNAQLDKKKKVISEIKWDENLSQLFERNIKLIYNRLLA